MKSITEYLSIKPKHIIKSFPKEKDINIIVDFLDKNGFERAPKEVSSDHAGMDDIFNYFMDNTASYILCEYMTNSFWIRIFKGGKITSKNPIFAMQIERGIKKDSYDEIEHELYGYETTTNDSYMWEHEHFLDEINKHFEWK